MKSSFSPERLELFGSIHGRELAAQVATTEPATLLHRVPPTWLDLVARPDAQGVRAIWEPAAARWPRFVSYLASSLEGAAPAPAGSYPP